MAPSDRSVLETVATGLLIRAGGRMVFTEQEWLAAIEHESTLYVSKMADSDVVIVLVPKEGVHD